MHIIDFEKYSEFNVTGCHNNSMKFDDECVHVHV
jgi:hypothetical protein